MIRTMFGILALSLLSGAALAQQAVPAAPGIAGTWRVDPKQMAGRKDAPRLVIVRSDSSASWGTETVRWRIRGDRLRLAIGGEWEEYRMKLKGKNLTLSEGDLVKPITFERVGPPSPRPADVRVPADPDAAGAGEIAR